MNLLESMNHAMDYIEDNLTEPLDFDEITKITACHASLFQRIFAYMTRIPLSEYIRRRKLSLAVSDLQNGTKVIDIAMKYGYESSDTFSHAFKRQHGVSPQKITDKNVVIKSYPRLVFTLSVKGVEEMNYRIAERDEFTVIGKSITTTPMNSQIGEFWGKCWQDGTGEKLMKLSPDKCMLGLCYNPHEDGSFDYMVGLEHDGKDVGDFEVLTVPKSTFAIFECKSDKANALPELWTRIMSEFLPSSEYRHAGTADMEIYYKWDDANHDYHTEVWIPIVKK